MTFCDLFLTRGESGLSACRQKPRAVEVFSNRMIAEHAREIAMELRSPDTVLLELR